MNISERKFCRTLRRFVALVDAAIIYLCYSYWNLSTEYYFTSLCRCTALFIIALFCTLLLKFSSLSCTLHSSFRWNPHTFALTSVFPADNFCANCVTCSPFYHTPYLFIFNKVFKPKMLAQFTLMCSHFQIKFIPFALFPLKFSSFKLLRISHRWKDIFKDTLLSLC